MADTLPGFELTAHRQTIEEANEEHAARVIDRVKHSFQADLDKLTEVISAGGNIIEMRAAVDAAWLFKEIIRGLDLAIDRALGHDKKGESDE